MSSSFVLTSVFAAVSLSIVGLTMLAFDLFFRTKQRVADRMRLAFSATASERAKQSPLFKDLQWMSPDMLLPQETLKWRWQTWIEQSGISISVGRLFLLSGTTAAAVGVLAWLGTQHWWCGLLGFAASIPAPFWGIHLVRQRRIHRLTQQLPEAFDVMSRVLRVGQTTQTAFQVVATDFPSPIAEEFSQSFEEQHLGVSFEIALRDLARRTGIMELHIFVVALIVNRRIGGNLAELLSRLAALVRQRVKMHGRVRALTGEGRMQAAVLLALPFLVFAAIFCCNREYAQILLDHPRLILATACSQAIGAIWIRRIIDIEV